VNEEMARYTGLVEGDQALALAWHVVRLLTEGQALPLARVAKACARARERIWYLGWPAEGSR
jgi:hypothetical protein